MEWQEAKDVRNEATDILSVLHLPHIDLTRIFFYRTHGSKARAYARTWGFPKIFQHALQVQPAYVIEVLAIYYDRLDTDQRKKVLIHEFLHIPKNFSGALLPHRTRHRHLNSDVNKLFTEYKKITHHKKI
jgi:predicted metallopeptidase